MFVDAFSSPLLFVTCSSLFTCSSFINIAGNTILLYGGFIPTTLPVANTLSIAVLHEPVSPEKLKHRCHLAFAGHLHGCQFVFWQHGNDLYPGKLFYRNNFIERRIGRFAYFISRGLGDTLPIRFNCPREIVRVVVGSGTPSTPQQLPSNRNKPVPRKYPAHTR
jgi:hypothetical protein